jgi:AcrR family transcriptional regulator
MSIVSAPSTRQMPWADARDPSSPSRARIDDVRDVALTLFAERGYHGTTMSQIAGVLGVRVATLYSHIRSKQGLLGEIFIETTNAVWADHERAIAGVEDITERLRRSIEAYALRHATHRRQALVVHRDLSALDEPARSPVIAKRRQHEHAIRQLIADGIEAGAFAVRSATMASFAILEMSVSIASWFREDGKLSAEAIARQYGEFALSIAAGGTSPTSR